MGISPGISHTGDKYGDIPGDTTTWGCPLLIPYLSLVGDIPGDIS